MQKTFTPNYLNNQPLQSNISDEELLYWAEKCEKMNLLPSSKSRSFILSYSKSTQWLKTDLKNFLVHKN